MAQFHWNLSLSPVWRTRRGEIKRPLSESAVHSFLVFSRHHTKHVFLIKPYLLSWIGPYLLYGEPEGTKSNALYHLAWWLLLWCSLGIIPNVLFSNKTIFLILNWTLPHLWRARWGQQRTPSIAWCGGYFFRGLPTSYDPLTFWP